VTATPDELDVAIVGGGVAGLYVAWRALTGTVGDDSPLARGADGAPPRVAVFEASSRLGGRLYSATPERTRMLRGELGGIAVMSTHAITRGAIDALGLERERLEGGDPNDLLYLRGHRFRATDWGDPAAVPYELEEGERGRSPEQLLAGAIERVVPEAGGLGPSDWQLVKQTREFEGRPLSDIGLWDLLRELVSPEAFQLMLDAGRFRPQFENWNAAEALADLCADWPEGTYYERLRDGYEALPIALAGAVREAGGEVSLGHGLRALELVSGERDPAVGMSFDIAGESAQRSVVARRVVLALPQRGLEALAPHSPLADSSRFTSDLRAVAAIPLFHVLLAYERPWWEELGIRTGRSATDLPLQSCFYFGTEGERPGADPENRRSLIMVGYNSPEAAEFWDRYLEAAEGEPRTPSPEMLRELTRQLSELHGTEVPDPYWALIMDWRPDPYGGASHRWAVGARSWEVIPRMREPLPGVGIHVCGEAWSDHQGWVEGALRSAERVARDELGLHVPGWLAEDQYVGP
jgi:monoamine oxidase